MYTCVISYKPSFAVAVERVQNSYCTIILKTQGIIKQLLYSEIVSLLDSLIY